MSESRLPRIVLYSELREGSRARGGQQKRFKDHLKRNLTICNINQENMEALAEDRAGWRRLCDDAVQRLEEHLITERAGRRARRHQGSLLPTNIPCPHCPRLFRARIGLNAHLRGSRCRRTDVPP